VHACGEVAGRRLGAEQRAGPVQGGQANLVKDERQLHEVTGAEFPVEGR